MPWDLWLKCSQSFMTLYEGIYHEASIYQVVTPYNDYNGGEGNHNHEINIVARTCGCGKWQNIKILCSHAIKVFQSLRVDLTNYIDPC